MALENNSRMSLRIPAVDKALLMRAAALQEACRSEVFTLSLTGRHGKNETLEALLEMLKEKSLEFRV